MISDPSTIGEQQRLFVKLVGDLILWVYGKGWALTFGEAWRTPEQAAWNAAHGTGIANSLHCEKLAIDLNLFVDDVYQTTKEAYAPVGEYWKSLHPMCRWGGDFHRPDSDHFSIEWSGVQ